VQGLQTHVSEGSYRCGISQNADNPAWVISQRRPPTSSLRQGYHQDLPHRGSSAAASRLLTPKRLNTSYRAQCGGEHGRGSRSEQSTYHDPRDSDRDFGKLLVHVPRVSDHSRSVDVEGRVRSGNVGSQSERGSVYNLPSERSSGNDSQHVMEHVIVKYGGDSDGDYTVIRPNKVYHFVDEREWG